MQSVATLWNKVSGYKTYIVCITTVLYAVLYYGLTQNDWPTAMSLILGSSGLGALRHAVSKQPLK